MTPRVNAGSHPRRVSWRHVALALLVCSGLSVPLGAGQRRSQQRVAGPGETQFNLQLLRPSGGPVIPIFEGWYQHPDGSYEL
jgi:hypothetical protein